MRLSQGYGVNQSDIWYSNNIDQLLISLFVFSSRSLYFPLSFPIVATFVEPFVSFHFPPCLLCFYLYCIFISLPVFVLLFFLTCHALFMICLCAFSKPFRFLGFSCSSFCMIDFCVSFCIAWSSFSIACSSFCMIHFCGFSKLFRFLGFLPLRSVCFPS